MDPVYSNRVMGEYVGAALGIVVGGAGIWQPQRTAEPVVDQPSYLMLTPP